MNQTLEHTQNDTQNQGAATEGKRGRAGRGATLSPGSDSATRPDTQAHTANGVGGTDSGSAESHRADATEASAAVSILGEHPQAKFVLFAIRPEERVNSGPVMRGFIELPAVDGAESVKISVAGWAKVGRESGTEYLSLKVGNTRQPPEGHTGPAEWEIGPFYGRLFKETANSRQGARIRYFGFVEHSERTGEDKNQRGIYTTHWQVSVHAKRAISGDGRTTYLSGTVTPTQGKDTGSDELPF